MKTRHPREHNPALALLRVVHASRTDSFTKSLSALNYVVLTLINERIMNEIYYINIRPSNHLAYVLYLFCCFELHSLAGQTTHPKHRITVGRIGNEICKRLSDACSNMIRCVSMMRLHCINKLIAGNCPSIASNQIDSHC